MVNADKTCNWANDISLSVAMYNYWYRAFAPQAFDAARQDSTEAVKKTLASTNYLINIDPFVLRNNPSILQVLRMTTTPPIARDRLIGLSGASQNLVKKMELDNILPPRMSDEALMTDLAKISRTIEQMADRTILPWLHNHTTRTDEQVNRASIIIADRLCSAIADPIIRNAQEQRQLSAMGAWLEQRGYRHIPVDERIDFRSMPPGTFSFRLNVPVFKEEGNITVNIPVDAVINPLNATGDNLPILFEAKSAGDFTNTNKRRKEEAVKMIQLRNTYGDSVKFVLFLCGYFNKKYLEYEAAEGIDWVWEHRIDDLSLFGL